MTNLHGNIEDDVKNFNAFNTVSCHHFCHSENWTKISKQSFIPLNRSCIAAVDLNLQWIICLSLRNQHEYHAKRRWFNEWLLALQKKMKLRMTKTAKSHMCVVVVVFGDDDDVIVFFHMEQFNVLCCWSTKHSATISLLFQKIIDRDF